MSESVIALRNKVTTLSLIRFNVARLLSFFCLYVITVLSHDVNAMNVIVDSLVNCNPEIIQINL